MSIPSRQAHSDSSVSADPTVLFRTINHIAFITLNRPGALNALDQSMIEQLASRLEQCRRDTDIVAVVIDSSNQKAFCAGGDVRALLHPGHDTRASIERYFASEYRLDFAIHRFPKPVVVVMDAVTMGGGMGLAQGAALRIATDRSRIAMPETKIGLTPDVGATHFLAAMPIELELYVGLTGAMLSGVDAVACGLADACVPHASLVDIEARLRAIDMHALANRTPVSGDNASQTKTMESDASPADASQAGVSRAEASRVAPSRADALTEALRNAFVATEIDPDTAAITRQREWITRHFQRDAAPSAIVTSLTQTLASLGENEATRAEREWLEATRTALTSYSPTMIHVTREALLRGRDITLADSFRLEMGIVVRSIEDGDFREGVRAHLIDKDRAPKWQPDTLEAVTPERIAHFLSSPWATHTHPLADLGSEAPHLTATTHPAS